MPISTQYFNDKFVYTLCDPENIIEAPKGAWFFRFENDFYLNLSGDMNGIWTKLPYRTVILPIPPLDALITYEYPTQLFLKTTDGFLDEFREVLPKTGWQFYSYDDVFVGSQYRNFGWSFPPPTGSGDSVGSNGSRSYDENFFYYKSGSLWTRTPISVFTFPGQPSGEQAALYNNLPYVVVPRYTPSPNTSFIQDTVSMGDQSYDIDFFYIKVSKWKRSPLISYNPSKMTIF